MLRAAPLWEESVEPSILLTMGLIIYGDLSQAGTHNPFS